MADMLAGDVLAVRALTSALVSMAQKGTAAKLERRTVVAEDRHALAYKFLASNVALVGIL